MNIQTKKLELVQSILNIDNSEFIQKVADFISKEKVDFWNELSLTERDEINQGIQELNEGKRVSYESFLKKVK